MGGFNKLEFIHADEREVVPPGRLPSRTEEEFEHIEPEAVEAEEATSGPPEEEGDILVEQKQEEQKETPLPEFSQEELDLIEDLQKRAKELKQQIQGAKDIDKEIELSEELRGVYDDLLSFKRAFAEREPEKVEYEDIEDLIREIEKPLLGDQATAMFQKSQSQWGRERWISKRRDRKHVILGRELEDAGFVPDPNQEYIVKVNDTRPGEIGGALIATKVIGLSPTERLEQFMEKRGYELVANYVTEDWDPGKKKMVRVSEENIAQMAIEVLGTRNPNIRIEDIKILPTARDTWGNPIGDSVSAWVKYKAGPAEDDAPQHKRGGPQIARMG